MKETQFRNKIIWFTFIFSLLVVWIHAYNAELFLGRTAASVFVYRFEHLIGDGLGQIAVPGFFMISAYLFFRNFTWEKLSSKWHSRIRSILVPYIVWNTIYYLGYVLGSRLPFVTEVMNKGEIPFTLSYAADAILHYTYNYVFWYLYQLILLILLTPVIYFLIRRFYIGLIYLMVLWIGLVMNVRLPELNLDAACYYSLAAFLALHGKGLVESCWSRRRCATGAACLLGAAAAYRYAGIFMEPWMFVLTRMLSVISLWLLISEAGLFPAREWMKHNFFLYATHFAFVRLINKTAAMLWPYVVSVPILFYLLMPALVLVISLGLGAVLRKYLPSIWNMLNGGRI